MRCGRKVWDMKYQVKETSVSQRVMTITIGASEVDKAFEKAFQERLKSLKLKGFRKGNVPARMAERYFVDGVLADRVANLLVPSVYKEALTELKLNPLAKPEWKIVECDRGKDLSVEATFHVFPLLDLTRHRGLSIRHPEPSISEAQVMARIQRLLAAHVKHSVYGPEHQAKMGDTLLCDYRCYCEGEELTHAAAKNSLLELKPDVFLKGLSENLVGVKAGEKRQFDVLVSQKYANPSLAGREVFFKVKVREIQSRTLPTLDDQFAQSAFGVESLTQLRANVHAGLLAEVAQRDNDEILVKIVKDLLEEVPMEVVPDSLRDGHIRLALDKKVEQLAQQGMTPEEYLKARNLTPERFGQEMAALGRIEARLEVLYRSVAKAEGVAVKHKELDAALEAQAKPLKLTAAAFKTKLEKEGTLKFLIHQLLVRKVRKTLRELAVVVREPDHSPTDQDTTQRISAKKKATAKKAVMAKPLGSKKKATVKKAVSKKAGSKKLALAKKSDSKKKAAVKKATAPNKAVSKKKATAKKATSAKKPLSKKKKASKKS